MGRAGSGGGGFHSSGGGHSGRSSGGHHISSRAGSSRSYSSSRSHSNHYGNNHYYGSRQITKFDVIITVIILIAGFIIYWMGLPKSTINREKLTDIPAYNNNCVIDEIGWINNKDKLSKDLKYFYNKTGIQPYVIMKGYDSSLTSDKSKEEWAIKYYDENIKSENGFLYVYFAEKDVDNDVGYMAYVNGYRTTSIMDSEAVGIFWKYIDKNWYTDMSTDDVFYKSFKSTADTIMVKSTTINDVLKYIIIGAILIGVLVALVVLIINKNKRDKEKAEETERILSSTMEEIGRSKTINDDLLDKYK